MAPPNRTARVAVLGSSVQRSQSSQYPSRSRAALVRRAVLAVLVIAALALLTISFRQPTSGALHSAQGAGAAVLRPFQVAAERVARPFRDVYGYFSGLAGAKSENARLRREVRVLRAQALANASATHDLAELQKLLAFEQGATYPKDYRAVNTRVISFPTDAANQQVAIAAGAHSGITLNTPVVTADGLIGRVTNVGPDSASVQLITDDDSAVAALDTGTGVTGLLRHGQGNTLILDRVPKELKVDPGDVIVTAGTRNPRYPDLYPRGIQIGRVSHVNRVDTATYIQIQIAPFAHFDSLDAVAALVSTKPVPTVP